MNKSNALGSLTVHASIVALVLLCGSVIHPVVEHQRHAEHLVFALPAADLPVPSVRPVSVKAIQAAVSTRPSADLTVARLVPSAPSTLRITRAVGEQQPRLVALSNPATLELPQSNVRVSEAPSVTVGVFGGTSGNLSGRSPAVARQAGFGAESAGSSNGHTGARVVTAGYDQTPELRAVTTSVPRPPSIQPAIVRYIPRPQFTAEARSAGISGEVTLKVCLKADGTVQVLGVVQGLGHGLNEEAARVAAGVQFTPEYRDGAPVGSIHTLTIDFELS